MSEFVATSVQVDKVSFGYRAEPRGMLPGFKRPFSAQVESSSKRTAPKQSSPGGALPSCQDQSDCALAEVSLQVEPGEVVGLVGPNGAGKSTLLQLLLGMLRPMQGHIAVFGLDPRADGVQVKRRIGYVAQERMFPGYRTVEAVLNLHRQVYPSWSDKHGLELSGRFGLGTLFSFPNRRLSSLSPGVLQALTIVCAAAHKPDLLLLDEPATGLDPAARRTCFQICTELAAEGTAVVLVSHAATDVERLANRILILQKRVLLDGDLAFLLENSCLALLPPEVREEQLQELPRFLLASQGKEGVEAVFLSSPQETLVAFAEVTSLTGVRCVPLSLEDLLVKLCEGQVK